MSKNVKIGLTVVIILMLLFAIIWMVYDAKKETVTNTNDIKTNLDNENTGLDNIINDLFDNVVVNEVSNTIENEINTNTNIETNEITNSELSNEIDNENHSNSVTSKEEKAIQLVKDEWGSTDGVYFSNMGIDSNGRYIVSVNRKDTTTIAFFTVDVNTGLVTRQ